MLIMTKYLTKMIVWISLLTMKKSNQHINFVRSNEIAKWSLVRVFLKVVPVSVQYQTAVDSATKVPIISGKELKGMINDLQFRSCTLFRWLAVKSHKSQDRVPSRISL